MRVPTRKPGKYAGQKPDPHLTEGKLNELKDKLSRLKNARPRAIEEVKRLASDGDFSENAAYQIAKGRLRGINRGIDEIEDQIKRAVIIRPSVSGKVQLGSRVTVAVNGKEKTYLILGSAETSPEAGIISHNSPIGSALMGRKAGEMIELKLKDRIVKYEIINIE